MKVTHIKKSTVLLFVIICLSANVVTFNDFSMFTEPSYLFLSLLGLGLIALGKLRRA